MHKTIDALNFIYRVIENAQDIAVVCDEDCFVTDWGAVEALCDDVKKYNFTHSGMPDGVVCHHRNFNWAVTNPFFLVLNTIELRKVLFMVDRDRVNRTQYVEWLEYIKPPFVNGQSPNKHYEPYDGLFYWLAQNGKPLYLESENHKDGLSTILKRNGSIFSLHSWFSRVYGRDAKHTNRINALYNEARSNNPV